VRLPSSWSRVASSRTVTLGRVDRLARTRFRGPEATYRCPWLVRGAHGYLWCPFTLIGPSNPGPGTGDRLAHAFLEHLDAQHPGWTPPILEAFRALRNDRIETIAHLLNHGTVAR
jgi:hypothetical protein